MPNPTDMQSGRLPGEGEWVAVTEVCQLYLIERTAVIELVELGVVAAREDSANDRMVAVASLSRLRVAARLMRDLGVNATGAALAVELLEERRDLERRVRRLERLAHE